MKQKRFKTGLNSIANSIHILYAICINYLALTWRTKRSYLNMKSINRRQDMPISKHSNQSFPRWVFPTPNQNEIRTIDYYICRMISWKWKLFIIWWNKLHSKRLVSQLLLFTFVAIFTDLFSCWLLAKSSFWFTYKKLFFGSYLNCIKRR